ncbi:hypothetical protein Back2_00270 [Nocardioides baekrokdamisoli]|uniref:DoxX family protein n=1 Tax=Nocardioides baekrokdamisoli TaxID=1804624 RepID=A0A3G9IAI9_9ACTN|nr:DoxX family protein [Nocardioides baekrokdamisoli]BBH15740.1 hypothetical protein Back2_00270 [Nocardioides baekrokdamisoli]
MDVWVWIVSSALAALFLLAGTTTVIRPTSVLLADPKLGLLATWPPWLIKVVGTLEIAGAAGLVLPPAAEVATWLAGAAAVGLAALMAGALVAHALRREWQQLLLCSATLVMAVFVAASRLS